MTTNTNTNTNNPTTSPSTKPTDCQQAIDVNLKIIEINNNIKKDYDNRVATALNNWQNAVSQKSTYMNNLRSLYQNGHYVLPDYRKTDGSSVETQALNLAGISNVADFYKNNVADFGELKSCLCGAGCCEQNAGWCQKCCAMAWRPSAMNSKNFTCGDCGYYGCGNWYKYLNPVPVGNTQFFEYLDDKHITNRLSTNIFEKFFGVKEAEYNASVANLESIYRNIAPPEYLKPFDILCCQTILGSNVNANASTITFDAMTNNCNPTITNPDLNPYTTTSNTSTTGPTSTKPPTTSSTTSTTVIYTAEQIYSKIKELPEEQQGAVWFAVALGILAFLIIIVLIFIAISNRNKETQNNNSTNTYNTKPV